MRRTESFRWCGSRPVQPRNFDPITLFLVIVGKGRKLDTFFASELVTTPT
jgi:hypothetical protein